MIDKRHLALGLLTGLTLIFLAASAALASNNYQPGQIIVKFRSAMAFQSDNSTGLESLDELTKRFSVTAVQPLWPVSAGARTQTEGPAGPQQANLQKYYLIQFDSKFSVDEVMAAYRHLALVDLAEPNYLVKAMATTPNDPDFYRQWGLKNTGQEYTPGHRGLAGKDIAATLAWDKNLGSRHIVVAVIDTGIQLDHPDLAANIWHNPGEIPNNGYDDDHNGFIDDYNGWNFARILDPKGRVIGGDNNNVLDDNGHGTAMSGIIGAVADNGLGIAGINWQIQIMPVKVLNTNGVGTYFDIANGITYAVSNGAKVLNMSLGGPDTSTILSDTIAFAVSQYCFISASVGNDGRRTVNYPAGYDGVTGVAATDDYDNHPGFSNFNATVDLSAPGVSIYTTKPGSIYWYVSGTSPAAAFVSGAAAWLLSSASGLHGSDIATILEDFAVDLGAAGWDPYFGYGRLMMNIVVPTPYASKVTLSDAETGNTIYTNDYVVGVGVNYIGTPAFVLLATKPDGSDGTWMTWEDFTSDPSFTFPKTPPNLTPEGTVYLYVRLKDVSGQIGNVRSGNIILDVTKPEMTQGVSFDNITEVKAGDLIPARPLIKFTLKDVVSGVNPQAVFVSLDSQPYACDSYDQLTDQFTFQVSMTLSAGLHNISVGHLADRAGNELATIELKNVRVAEALAAGDFDPGVKPFGWYDPTTDLIYVGYSLTGDADCKIRVFDPAGNTLWQNNYLAGTEGGHFGYNQISWDGFWGGHRMSYGVYPFVLSLESGNRYATGNLVFVPR